MALVGAGPGEPDLMTLRAEAELAAAAVVVTDVALEGLVRYLAPQAGVVVVPDRRPATAVLLAALARADGGVVRLYVGDPWLHPAHGSELAALDRAGIASEPVAGVATEVAVPALAGIAVHVRQLAVACTIGPLEAIPTAPDRARTLVIRTEDAGAAAIRLGTGDDSDIPAAAVPLDRPDAAAVRGSLAEIGSRAPAGRCLLVVGAVAGSHGHPRVAPTDAEGRSIGALPPEPGGSQPAGAAADLAGGGAAPADSIGRGTGPAEVPGIVGAGAPGPDRSAGGSRSGQQGDASNPRSSEAGGDDPDARDPLVPGPVVVPGRSWALGAGSLSSRVVSAASEQHPPPDKHPHLTTGPSGSEDGTACRRAPVGGAGFAGPERPGGSGWARHQGEGVDKGTGDRGRGRHGSATSDHTAGGGR